MDFDNLLTKVDQPFGEETNAYLERQQTTFFTLYHHHRVECLGLFVLGAYGFGKQTMGEGLLLLCMKIHSRQ